MEAVLPYWPAIALVLTIIVNQIIANNPKWPYNSLLTAILGMLTGMIPKPVVPPVEPPK